MHQRLPEVWIGAVPSLTWSHVTYLSAGTSNLIADN
jgi:hypothetical protein